MSGNLEPVLRQTSPLSRLWCLHFYDLNIPLPVYNARIDNHLKRVADTKKEKNISDYKGNLLKALDKDNIPWQRFCQGMGILAPDGYTFSLYCRLGKTKYNKTLKLGHCHDEPMGEYLAEMWKEVKELYPDRYKDWKKLANEYSKKEASAKKKKHTSIASNTKSVLANSSLTWKTFYRAMMILDFDAFSIKVNVDNLETSVIIVEGAEEKAERMSKG